MGNMEMTIDEAIKTLEEFRESLKEIGVQIYDNENEAFETLIKAAKECEMLRDFAREWYRNL